MSSSTLSTPSNIQVLPFAVSLPDEHLLEMASASGSAKTNGVVGTITWMGSKSVMIWVGWGALEPCSSSVMEEDGTAGSSGFSTRVDGEDGMKLVGVGIPTMGPLTVAMPRTTYAGMSSHDEAPCSQLICGPNDEEMMMGWQMANRLSRKIGSPVFVSTSLISASTNQNDGGSNAISSGVGMGVGDEIQYETPIMAQRAAALAEKEIGRILLERKASSAST